MSEDAVLKVVMYEEGAARKPLLLCNITLDLAIEYHRIYLDSSPPFQSLS